jgi:hypothetical protein
MAPGFRAAVHLSGTRTTVLTVAAGMKPKLLARKLPWTPAKLSAKRQFLRPGATGAPQAHARPRNPPPPVQLPLFAQPAERLPADSQWGSLLSHEDAPLVGGLSDEESDGPESPVHQHLEHEVFAAPAFQHLAFRDYVRPLWADTGFRTIVLSCPVQNPTTKAIGEAALEQLGLSRFGTLHQRTLRHALSPTRL